MKQFLFSLIGGLDGAQEQAFAETSGPGKEIIIAGLSQFPDKSGFIDIIAIAFNQLGKGLDPDGQLFHNLT
ncbi:MAG: hypothetical protein K9K64_14035 [Desulfohalobiaceae bacterium]|nr:hypothetical protein [Desulfohalobiaceae bacterium]